MAQQRHGAYDENGVCTRTWYEEVPDPPVVQTGADVTALDPADVTALQLGLATALTVASLRTVVGDLITRLST